MRNSIFTLAVVFGLAAGPALAHQCPAMMAEIDAALQTAGLTDADRARVEELREQGEALHEAGDHADSEAALAEALEILDS